MGAKNKVIAGDYPKWLVLSMFGTISINAPYGMKEYDVKTIPINKDTVTNYEIVEEESHKSATSAVGRGLVGAAVLGPVGLLAGLSAKSKGIHTIALQFKDGKKSLIEVDDKIYKSIIKVLF